MGVTFRKVEFSVCAQELLFSVRFVH